MRVRAAPLLPPDEAARRVAVPGAKAVWVSSPGPDEDVGIAFDVVAADPVEVLRGRSLADLERAWREAVVRWRKDGEAPGSDVPIGIGWIGYDLGCALVLGTHPPDMGLEVRFFDAVWVCRRGEAHAQIYAVSDRAADRLCAAVAREPPPRSPPQIGPLRAVTAPEAYLAAVARIQEHLLAGEVYQVNLSRKLEATVRPGDPVWMAAALRARAPAPHAFWMAEASLHEGAPSENAYIVGNSPERFLRLAVDGRIETRPIKGTRGRVADPGGDAAALDALRGSPKDRAEHVMIVDLERNDLGRICEVGSIRVVEPLRVVALPTVFHLVSTVSGLLRRGTSLSAVLAATFPGGSITGAPKRRAIEIIAELEGQPRGVYTGATGWFGAAGDLDLAVAIRTAVVDGERFELSVGGGIVVDSRPEDELAETDIKSQAFLRVCAAAPTGS